MIWRFFGTRFGWLCGPSGHSLELLVDHHFPIANPICQNPEFEPFQLVQLLERSAQLGIRPGGTEAARRELKQLAQISGEPDNYQSTENTCAYLSLVDGTVRGEVFLDTSIFLSVLNDFKVFSQGQLQRYFCVSFSGVPMVGEYAASVKQGAVSDFLEGLRAITFDVDPQFSFWSGVPLPEKISKEELFDQLRNYI